MPWRSRTGLISLSKWADANKNKLGGNEVVFEFLGLVFRALHQAEHSRAQARFGPAGYLRQFLEPLVERCDQAIHVPRSPFDE